jgi:hypothetical protein
MVVSGFICSCNVGQDVCLTYKEKCSLIFKDVITFYYIISKNIMKALLLFYC